MLSSSSVTSNCDEVAEWLGLAGWLCGGCDVADRRGFAGPFVPLPFKWGHRLPLPATEEGCEGLAWAAEGEQQHQEHVGGVHKVRGRSLYVGGVHKVRGRSLYVGGVHKVRGRSLYVGGVHKVRGRSLYVGGVHKVRGRSLYVGGVHKVRGRSLYVGGVHKVRGRSLWQHARVLPGKMFHRVEKAHCLVEKLGKYCSLN